MGFFNRINQLEQQFAGDLRAFFEGTGLKVAKVTFNEDYASNEVEFSYTVEVTGRMGGLQELFRMVNDRDLDICDFDNYAVFDITEGLLEEIHDFEDVGIVRNGVEYKIDADNCFIEFVFEH